jgi:hypothetical protein
VVREVFNAFRQEGSALALISPRPTGIVDRVPAVLRTRSFSMNAWLRSKFSNDPDYPGWALSFGQYLAQREKYSQILIPGPSGVFVFIDEHEQSIDDGEFHTSQADPRDALMRDGTSGEDPLI